MDMRKVTSIVSIVLGSIFIVAGLATIVLVTVELDEQNITIPDDGCLGGWDVRGPFTAWCQADIIDKHALESTGGLTYAELDREDPLRDTAMNASFLRASLFTSIVAYGVAAMAVAMGIVFILIGLGIKDVHRHLDRLGLLHGGSGGDTGNETPTAAASPAPDASAVPPSDEET
ncbi:MAG: hypothetical protein U5K29_03845 [Acidimicrobiales bacterium]|nr:hypothetical protein [Acidimicrobiales bacterium]